MNAHLLKWPNYMQPPQVDRFSVFLIFYFRYFLYFSFVVDISIIKIPFLVILFFSSSSTDIYFTTTSIITTTLSVIQNFSIFIFPFHLFIFFASSTPTLSFTVAHFSLFLYFHTIIKCLPNYYNYQFSFESYKLNRLSPWCRLSGYLSRSNSLSHFRTWLSSWLLREGKLGFFSDMIHLMVSILVFFPLGSVFTFVCLQCMNFRCSCITFLVFYLLFYFETLFPLRFVLSS